MVDIDPHAHLDRDRDQAHPRGDRTRRSPCSPHRRRWRQKGPTSRQRRPTALSSDFGTGQPMLISMWSARSSATIIDTASAITPGSTPVQLDAARGLVRVEGTHPQCRLIALQERSRGHHLRDVQPSTCSRHSLRKARFVTPAIGAKTTGTARSNPPRRSPVAQQDGSLSASHPGRASIPIRSCDIVSRSRTVTARSVRVSKSTVTQ